MRWYWPDGWSKKAAEREANKIAADFERRCNKGEIQNRREKKVAEEVAIEERAQIKTVKEYGESVFMAKKTLTMSNNGISNYRQFLNKHIYPAIGDIPLVDVTRAMCEKILVDMQRKGYKSASLIKGYNILNGLFDSAFGDDSIQISPMLKVKRPTITKKEKEAVKAKEALSEDEVRHVIACAREDYETALPEDKAKALKWYAYIVVSADLWARRGEICALRWTDIDFEAETVTISRNLQYTLEHGVYETTPKNGKARTIDIGSKTLDVLRLLRLSQAQNCVSPYVFTQDGIQDRMHPQSPTGYFAKFSKKHNIEGFHSHILRHSGATNAILSGADVASVSARLGHSDIAVTLRMYTHPNAEGIRRAGQIYRERITN